MLHLNYCIYVASNYSITYLKNLKKKSLMTPSMPLTCPEIIISFYKVLDSISLVGLRPIAGPAVFLCYSRPKTALSLVSSLMEML